MRCAFPFVLFALVGCAEPQAAPAPQPAANPQPIAAPDIPSVETVRGLLDAAEWRCGVSPPSQEMLDADATLLAFGERAFPVYEIILADPMSDGHRDILRVFSVISRLEVDRRRFIPLVVQHLGLNTKAQVCRLVAMYLLENPILDASVFADLLLVLQHFCIWGDYFVREAAADLLTEIGDEREAEAIRPYLKGNDTTMRRIAADALAKIGVKQDLEAMDAWLKADDPRKDADEQQHFKKRRDELEARLKAHPIPRTLSN